MIKSISIKNYILIDELEVEFDSALNVITGETGAGKSILINAIDIAHLYLEQAKKQNISSNIKNLDSKQKKETSTALQ